MRALEPKTLFIALAISLGAGLAFATGCSDDSFPQKHADNDSMLLKALSRINPQALAGDTVALKVVLLRQSDQVEQAEANAFGMAGEPISWKVLGPMPQGASLAAPSTLTDDTGIAEMAFHVGTRSDITVQVQAQGPCTAAVTFSVHIFKEQFDLQVVGPSSIASVVERGESLRVQVVRLAQGDLPASAAAHVTLHARIKGGARNGARMLDSNAPGDNSSATTNALGLATFQFHTGTLQNSTYEIVVCDGGTCPLVPEKTFMVTVAARASHNGDCQLASDCDDGLVCSENVCQALNSYCINSDDCPDGYACHPVERVCAIDDGSPSCSNNTQCPDGWSCLGTGSCSPTASGGAALDVRGTWHTEHHFDLSNALPTFVNDFAPVLDFANVAFAGQLQINTPIIGPLIEALLYALIAEYVPSWVPRVTQSLADFIHFFKNIETQGEMLLNQQPTVPQLGPEVSGSETWVGAAIYVASTCLGGPAQFVADPSCGRIDIAVQPSFDLGYSNDSPTVGSQLAPFNGLVIGDTLRLTNRRTALEMRQLVNVALDLLVAVASQGQFFNFESFLFDLVPCTELQAAFDDLVCDLTDGAVCYVGGLEPLCEAASLAAIGALNQALGKIPVALDLHFDATARIYDTTGNGRGDRLGSRSNPKAAGECSIVGKSQTILLVGGHFDDNSYWFGER